MQGVVFIGNGIVDNRFLFFYMLFDIIFNFFQIIVFFCFLKNISIEVYFIKLYCLLFFFVIIIYKLFLIIF